MSNQKALTLLNPQNGNLALKLLHFENNDFFDHIQRNNFYSLIWIRQGNGNVSVDFADYTFQSNNLFAFSPYQPFMFHPEKEMKGIAIQFHSDFFCIHKHQKEVACNGVLFNNIYQPPGLHIDANTSVELEALVEQLRSEMQHAALAQYELLISYLKILLIKASRIKTEQYSEALNAVSDVKEPFILQSLQTEIEKNFKEKHSASDYANLLNITPKALAKLTKAHLNKTLTSLISERIVIEAKRELYLTNKTVKQIASELGYQDEYYFSRFFKNNTSISPQIYRETVGFDKLSSA